MWHITFTITPTEILWAIVVACAAVGTAATVYVHRTERAEALRRLRSGGGYRR